MCTRVRGLLNIFCVLILLCMLFSTLAVGVSAVELTEGKYKVNIALYHSEEDKESMAASAIGAVATIVVKNGVKSMHITCGEMTMGPITASLQELRIADSQGNYTDAIVETRDSDGNPTGFYFALPHTQEFINVKVNPHIAIMGNADIDARIKVDYSTLTKVEESTVAVEKTTVVPTENNDNKSVSLNILTTEETVATEVAAQNNSFTQVHTVESVTVVDSTELSTEDIESISEVSVSDRREKKTFFKWILLLLIPVAITVVAVSIESHSEKKKTKK